MVKALLFDLDGTLLNTSKGIIRTADLTAKEMGLEPCKDMVRYAKFIGPQLHIGFNLVYGLTGEEAYKAAKIYKSHYPETGVHVYEYYDGLLETVSELKKRGYKTGICTLKNENAAKEMISSSRFKDLIDIIHGSDMAETLNKADIVRLTLRDLNVDATEAVLIGDSLSDAKGAKDAHVPFLAVSWGFGFPDGVGEYDHVDRHEDLLRLYKGVNMMEKIETKAAPAAIGPYSQAVKANGMLFCSGQIPLDPETGAIVEGDVKDQARRVFKNIEAILTEAGTSKDKIVKATVFLKSMDDFGAVNEVYASYFEGSAILPARSAVAVAKLPKDVMVEIEVIALL